MIEVSVDLKGWGSMRAVLRRARPDADAWVVELADGVVSRATGEWNVEEMRVEHWQSLMGAGGYRSQSLDMDTARADIERALRAALIERFRVRLPCYYVTPFDCLHGPVLHAGRRSSRQP